MTTRRKLVHPGTKLIWITVIVFVGLVLVASLFSSLNTALALDQTNATYDVSKDQVGAGDQIIPAAGESVLVEKGVLVFNTNDLDQNGNRDAIQSMSGAGNITVKNNGTVGTKDGTEEFGAIFLSGVSEHVLNTATGLLEAYNEDVELPAGHSIVENDGKMLGHGFGIYSGEPPGGDHAIAGEGNNIFKNFGTIAVKHSSAIQAQSGGNMLNNTGTISSSDGYGVHFYSNASDPADTINNSGSITGYGGTSGAVQGTIAIQLGDAPSTLVNAGSITGNVVFGGGNDTYDGSNGVIAGSVRAGAGNDTLLGGRQADVLVAGAGSDTLKGGGGADTLVSGAGQDSLTGGAGPDTFVFKRASDSTGVFFDSVADFDASQDSFAVPTLISGVDSKITTGSLSKATFDADLTGLLGLQKNGKNIYPLISQHAVLFAPSAGDYVGQTFLIVDANGMNGYQAGADVVINLGSNSANLKSLAASNFVNTGPIKIP